MLLLHLDLEARIAGNRSCSGIAISEWRYVIKQYLQPTEILLSYKDSPNAATVKFKDFKVENLQHAEMSFIAVNIFCVLSVGVYRYLPHLCSLPGKIPLFFQTSGLAQVAVTDLSTTVLVDSALTLLGCPWFDTFCCHSYACVRHLRQPVEPWSSPLSLQTVQSWWQESAWPPVCQCAIQQQEQRLDGKADRSRSLAAVLIQATMETVL